MSTQTLTSLTAAQPVTPQTFLSQIAFGASITQALYVAAKLGIADFLAEGPQSVRELAFDTKTHERINVSGAFKNAPPQRSDSMNVVGWSAILLSILAIGAVRSQTLTAVGDSSLQSFLPKFEEGISGFLNGDTRIWKQNLSRRDDITLMGGWGGYEKGWSEAGPWYDRAAERFKESGARVKVEYLSTGASGDLAFTVTIERSEVRLADQNQPSPMALRVTQFFRKEGGVWKLIHRHADPLISKTAPATVLQKD